MIRTIIRSLKKSKRLRCISLRLTPPENILNQVSPRTFDYTQMDKAEEELYDLCESDPELSMILQKHGANRDTINKVYTQLIEVGAGQYARGHFVAASSLAFGFTLDYVLNHKDDKDFDIIAYNLIQYFEVNRKGPVE